VRWQLRRSRAANTSRAAYTAHTTDATDTTHAAHSTDTSDATHTAHATHTAGSAVVRRSIPTGWVVARVAIVAAVHAAEPNPDRQEAIAPGESEAPARVWVVANVHAVSDWTWIEDVRGNIWRVIPPGPVDGNAVPRIRIDITRRVSDVDDLRCGLVDRYVCHVVHGLRGRDLLDLVHWHAVGYDPRPGRLVRD